MHFLGAYLTHKTMQEAGGRQGMGDCSSASTAFLGKKHATRTCVLYPKLQQSPRMQSWPGLSFSDGGGGSSPSKRESNARQNKHETHGSVVTFLRSCSYF